MREILPGVFDDRGKICTKNFLKGVSVYGERLFSIDGAEYRQWDPKRSKLGAAIMKGANIPDVNEKSNWLYLGCASGTTVSHISDFTSKGMIYALDFAPRVIRDFIFMCDRRGNLIPLLGDASKPETYAQRISLVDVLFQDIAQKFQVDIFLKNLRFLKKDGIAMLSVKARSIDVAMRPREIFDNVKKQLNASGKLKIIDFKTLEPFEGDHCFFVCRKL